MELFIFYQIMYFNLNNDKEESTMGGPTSVRCETADTKANSWTINTQITGTIY